MTNRIGELANTSGEDWHPEDVKAAIRKRGKTLVQLAKDHGLAPSTIRMALLRPSPMGENIVAKFLKLSPREIWPERWAERDAKQSLQGEQ